MNTTAAPQRRSPFPKAKITKCLTAIMPKGRDFQLRVKDSALPGLKVVHVVTQAWNRQPNTDRILKVIKVIRPALTEEENESILHFSVLTPAEYAEAVESSKVQSGKRVAHNIQAMELPD